MQKQHAWSIDLALLLIFYGFLFTLFLGSHPLISPDETRYVGIAWSMFKEHNYITPLLAGSPFLGKPILYYWFENIAFHAFGVNDFAARFFPAMIGLITCLMTYIFGRLVYNRRTGLLASLMVAAAPMYFMLTHYTNMDGEVASWLTCSMLSLLIGIHHLNSQKLSTVWFYLAYFFAALAFLTKGLMGIVFPAMVLFFWMLALNQWKLLLRIHLVRGLILFLILITPWLYLCEQQNPGFIQYFFIWNQFDRFIGTHFNQHKPWFFYLPFVIAGIFPFVFYTIQSYGYHLKNFKKHRHQHSTALFVFLWIVLITLFFSIPSSKLVGYIGPVIPATAILMAIYITQNWDHTPSKANKISTWVLVIILPIAGIVLSSLAFIIPQQAGILASAPYARALTAILFIASGFLAFGLLKSKPFSFIIKTLLVMTFAVNLTLLSSLKTWDLQYNWPIAAKTRHYLKHYPHAKVLMFGNYYYSIPMYLDRNVPTIANWDPKHIHNMPDNWQRQIEEGLFAFKKNFPDTLMKPDTFQKVWKQAQISHTTLLVIVDQRTLSHLNQLVNGSNKYKILAHVPRRHALIITNNHTLTSLP